MAESPPNPNAGQPTPDAVASGDIFGVYDIEPTLAPSMLPEDMPMGPMLDPYEMLGRTPPRELVFGHIALLRTATQNIHTGNLPGTKAGEGEIVTVRDPHHMPREEVERREGHLNNFYTTDAKGNSIIRPEVPQDLQILVGAAKARHGKVLRPMRRQEQPLPPRAQTAPSVPEGEVLADKYAESLRELRDRINNAKENIQAKKDEEIDNSGHTYTVTSKKGKAKRLNMWNMLNKLEARVTKQQNVKEATQELKAAAAEVKPLHLANEELVDKGDRAVRNRLLQSVADLLPGRQRRTLRVRNKVLSGGSINLVKEQPVKR